MSNNRQPPPLPPMTRDRVYKMDDVEDLPVGNAEILARLRRVETMTYIALAMASGAALWIGERMLMWR